MSKYLYVIFLLQIPNAFSCSCISDATTFKEELEGYKAIFAGTVVSTSEIGGDWDTAFYKSSIKVNRVWKNEDVEPEVYLKTSTEQNSCGGPPPVIGDEYLIFSRTVTDGLYLTGGCTPYINLTEVNKNVETLSVEMQQVWAEYWQELGLPIKVFGE